MRIGGWPQNTQDIPILMNALVKTFDYPRSHLKSPLENHLEIDESTDLDHR
jgi:hypothetical protein